MAAKKNDDEKYKETEKRDKDDASETPPPDMHDGQTIMDMSPLPKGPAKPVEPPTGATFPNPTAPTLRAPPVGAELTPPSQRGVNTTPPSRGGGLAGRVKRDTNDMPPEVRPFLNDPQRHINQYVLVKQVGAGGMGAVWKAWDTRLTRWVAVKQLNVTEEESVLRFEREAKLAGRLMHPNICQIYDFDEHEGRYYLVMQFIDGASIAKAALPMRQMLEAFVKVCRGIDFAHKNAIIHRDIKPANIMVNSSGEPFVTDFGLAKLLQTESSISIVGAVMGTPAYMPPEQATGKIQALDAKSDVYSLGATLYMLTTGRAPFEADNATSLLFKVCSTDPEPPRKINPMVPPAIEAITLKAMDKDKRRRYESAAAMAEDIQRFLSDQPIVAKPPTALQIVLRKIQKNPLPFAGGFMMAVAVIVVVLVVVLRPTPEPVEPTPPAPPVVVTKDPPPISEEEKRRLEEEKRVEAWKEAWSDVRGALAWLDFKGARPEAAEKAKKHLVAAPESARDALHKDAAGWLRDELDRLPQAAEWPRASWDEKRPAAQRASDYCAMILATVDGLPDKFDKVRETAKTLASSYAPVLGYKGTFSLKLYVMPYADVQSVSVGGAVVFENGRPAGSVKLVGGSSITPIALQNLEIGDVVVKLAHPELGTQELKIAAGDLQNGQTYLYSGAMGKPKSFRLRPSP